MSVGRLSCAKNASANMPRRWLNWDAYRQTLTTGRKPNRGYDYEDGVNPKRPQPPRVGGRHDSRSQDDRADDRYDEREADGENDE